MAGPKLHIDLDAIVANWRQFNQRAAPGTAAAVVKADAYGLGAAPVGRALARAGCAQFYVAWPSEGAALRQSLGDGVLILVFHGPTPDTIGLFEAYQLVPVLNSLEQIEFWRTHGQARPAAVHVDTGMNRLGVSEPDWASAANLHPNPIRLISHLSCGDEDSPANAEQLAAFERARAFWPDAQRSLAATGGAYLGKAWLCDEIRPGIGLYGGGPVPVAGPPARNVVTLTASVLQVRDIRKGESAGYGRTWTAAYGATLATIGLGYADGYLRSASNRGHVVVAGQKRPIVGRVSMDLTIIDVTGLSVSAGDDIEVIGPNMPLAEAAGAMGTIDYEILTRLGSRIERSYSGGE